MKDSSMQIIKQEPLEAHQLLTEDIKIEEVFVTEDIIKKEPQIDETSNNSSLGISNDNTIQDLDSFEDAIIAETFPPVKKEDNIEEEPEILSIKIEDPLQVDVNCIHEDANPSTSVNAKKRSLDDQSQDATTVKKSKIDPLIDFENSFWSNTASLVNILTMKFRSSNNNLEDNLVNLFGLGLGGIGLFDNHFGELYRRGLFNERTVWSKSRSSTWYENDVPLFTATEFKEHFRFTRSVFNKIVTELKPFLQKKITTFRDPVAVDKRIALSLYYLTSTKELSVVSDLFAIGKSTAHTIIHEFVEVVNQSLLKKYVKFPLKVNELENCANEFEEFGRLGYPQCVGAIGSCHFSVSPPKENAKAYHNLEKYYSIVMFAAVNAKYQFSFISLHPGTNNDSHILQTTSLQKILDSNVFDQKLKNFATENIPHHLIGNSDFPLTRHLQKPFPEHQELNEKQKKYNHTLLTSLGVVEVAFGRLRARFRKITKRMEFDTLFSTKVINSCCILHNIAEMNSDSVSPDWIKKMQEETDYPQPAGPSCSKDSNSSGKSIRNSVANYLYHLNN